MNPEICSEEQTSESTTSRQNHSGMSSSQSSMLKRDEMFRGRSSEFMALRTKSNSSQERESSTKTSMKKTWRTHNLISNTEYKLTLHTEMLHGYVIPPRTCVRHNVVTVHFEARRASQSEQRQYSQVRNSTA